MTAADLSLAEAIALETDALLVKAQQAVVEFARIPVVIQADVEIFEILQKLKAEGLTMLLVEQDVQMALAISDYAYVLASGRVELQGPSREIAQNEQVRQAYPIWVSEDKKSPGTAPGDFFCCGSDLLPAKKPE